MNKKIKIIGVTQDLGASRRGVDMGPGAIRVAGIHDLLRKYGYDVEDDGNIVGHDIANVNNKYHDEKLNYLDYIIKSCVELKERVEKAVKEGYFPLVLGGDHSLAIGTLAGMKKHHGGRTGIIWVDAHGDFNTAETTPSGNIHGMPFAVLTGRGDKRLLDVGPSPTVIESNAVLIGARDLDSGEIELLKNSKVTVFTMADIDRLGMFEVAKRAVEIAGKDVDNVHVSFDIDVMDPEYAPGTGTRVVGGLTIREAHLLLETVYNSNKLASMEMVEVNPTLDIVNKTAELAVSLIGSALGSKTIPIQD